MEEPSPHVENRTAPAVRQSLAEPGRTTAKMGCSQEGLAVRRVWRAHRYPPASLSHRFARSPIDALIHPIVGSGLRRQIPIGLNVHPLIRLRITTVIPQRWPARRGNLRGIWIDPDVIKDLADLRALGNECDQADLPTAQRAQQREHFANTGDQHRPQAVRR